MKRVESRCKEEMSFLLLTEPFSGLFDEEEMTEKYETTQATTILAISIE